MGQQVLATGQWHTALPDNKIIWSPLTRGLCDIRPNSMSNRMPLFANLREITLDLSPTLAFGEADRGDGTTTTFAYSQGILALLCALNTGLDAGSPLRTMALKQLTLKLSDLEAAIQFPATWISDWLQLRHVGKAALRPDLGYHVPHWELLRSFLQEGRVLMVNQYFTGGHKKFGVENFPRFEEFELSLERSEVVYRVKGYVPFTIKAGVN